MTLIYITIQILWGLPQTLLGFMVFLFNLKGKHYLFHGAIVTEWKAKSSVSLGLFVFVTDKPYFAEKLKEGYTEQELSRRLLVHEYGHTVQSLVLGPLYLIVMGIPSTVWGFWPTAAKRRKEEKISYFSFFTERWANQLGEHVTKEKSMEQLLID